MKNFPKVPLPLQPLRQDSRALNPLQILFPITENFCNRKLTPPNQENKSLATFKNL